MNFIIARFSRDNFWNLIVYFGVLLTVCISVQIDSMCCLISAFTVAPYILTRFNKIRYLENGACVNSRGNDLSNRLPLLILPIIILNFILCVFGDVAGLFGFLSKIPQPFKFTAFIGCIMLWPMLYFIIKNCPISILFNVESWFGNSSGSASGFIRSSESHSALHHRPMNNSQAYSSSSNDFITSPVYSYLPQNVYHNSHHNSHNRRY